MDDRAPEATSRPAKPRLTRALRVAAKVLGLVALALMTLYVGAYFALASTPGRELLRGVVGDALRRTDPAVTVAEARWGPAPGALWASGITLATPVGRAEVSLVRARVAVPSMAPEAVEVWIDKLAVTLPPPEATPPVVAAATPSGARRANAVVVPDVRVFVDEVDLVTPGEAFHALRVEARGAIGAAHAIEIRTGTCHASWMRGRRVSGWDRCELHARTDGKRAFEDLRVVLARGDQTVLDARGRAILPGNKDEDLIVDVVADLDLGPWDATVLAGDQLPDGLVAQGVEVHVADGLVRGSVAALHAPRVVNGPMSAELVSLEVPRYEGEPGLIVPRVALVVSGLVGARVDAIDWSVEGVSAPWLDLALEKKLVGQLPGVTIDRWSFPGGATGPLASDVDVAIGISGGSVGGLVTTPDGVFLANGRLKKSPITKRSSFVATASFEGLRGPLVDLVTHDLGAAERALLGAADARPEPLAGGFELAVELDRASRWDPWVVELEWDASELVGRTRLVWDGSSWVEEAAAPEPEGDEGEPDDAETAEP
ncbi:MAG: hypothetical protein IT385_08435 [Deltaproteobacteria bacterium]|nr:hypothetical protein [Deltaproteobacteria bacterium]